jgi:hypothetical protein
MFQRSKKRAASVPGTPYVITGPRFLLDQREKSPLRFLTRLAPNGGMSRRYTVPIEPRTAKPVGLAPGVVPLSFVVGASDDEILTLCSVARAWAGGCRAGGVVPPQLAAHRIGTRVSRERGGLRSQVEASASDRHAVRDHRPRRGGTDSGKCLESAAIDCVRHAPASRRSGQGLS